MKPSAIPPDEHQATILIVDDIPANIGMLAEYLEDSGYRVVIAQDGEEALVRTQFGQPDLILLDVMMPGMSGFETCRRLKAQDDDTREIPVIFMTALAAHPALLDEAHRIREELDLAFLRDDLTNLLEESLDGVQRVRRIVQDLKDFSHVGEKEKQLVNLHPGIGSTLNIAWHEIKHKAQVKKEYANLPEIA